MLTIIADLIESTIPIHEDGENVTGRVNGAAETVVQ
jgi:hypothetical protein